MGPERQKAEQHRICDLLQGCGGLTLSCDMWPTSFALIELTAAEEAKIAALVKKAVS